MNLKTNILLGCILAVLVVIGVQISDMESEIGSSTDQIVTVDSGVKTGVERIDDTLSDVTACPPNDPLGLTTNCQINTNQTNPLGI